jgi:hypothetical protein
MWSVLCFKEVVLIISVIRNRDILTTCTKVILQIKKYCEKNDIQGLLKHDIFFYLLFFIH